MWVIAGAGAFALGRLSRAGRPGGWVLEASVSLLAAFAAGIAATVLDFGGLQEPDWRAGATAARELGLQRRAGRMEEAESS